MFRTALLSLPIAVLPIMGMAESVPVWCCPDQCKTDDGGAALMPRSDMSGGFDLVLMGQRVPVMPGAFQGSEPGGAMQYCLGYDAFGDLQVKCLFVPSIV